jgi:hypothetical protein
MTIKFNRIDWRKLAASQTPDDDEDRPASPDLIESVGFDSDDISKAEWDEVAREAKAEDSKKSNKHTEKTESENPMPKHTSEKIPKMLLIKGYMTAEGADRKTESQLVELAMKEYPGWKEKTIREAISWMKSTDRPGYLKAQGLKCTLLPEPHRPGAMKSDKLVKQVKRKRSSYMSAYDLRLDKKRIKIWGYDKSEKFVCRLEINAAGVEVFAGERGGKSLCNLTWESLVVQLSKP